MLSSASSASGSEVEWWEEEEGRVGVSGGRRSTGDRGFGAGFGGEGGELTAGLGGHDGVRVDYVYASGKFALRRTRRGKRSGRGAYR